MKIKAKFFLPFLAITFFISCFIATNKVHAEMYLKDLFGVTREQIVNELQAHEHDDYYLGTQYIAGAWKSPNGDTSFNSSVGMNCGGFISYVIGKLSGHTSTNFESTFVNVFNQYNQK